MTILLSTLLCAGLARGASTSESSYVWNADGNIRATCHEDLDVARVYCNSWLDLAKHARIGQTFRCPGDRLESVYIGQWRYNPGVSVGKQVSAVALTVRRDGPEGEVVAETVFARGKVPRGPVRIEVGMPSKPDVVWYVEVRALASTVPEKQIFLNARCVDCYPDGALYLDGVASEGELCIRVVGSREVKGRRPGDVVFWSAKPEQRIWLSASRTLGPMLADDPKAPVRLCAARGEYESAQLIVTPRPGFRLQTAALTVTDLVGPKRTAIGKDQIRIEWVRHVEEWWRIPGHRSLVPDPLQPTARAACDESDEPVNTTFWVTVHVPRGIPAGLYRGEAIATLNAHSVLKRVIEVEVFDFEIPAQTHTRTGLFAGTGSDWVIRDLAQHRIAQGMPLHRPWHVFVRYPPPGVDGHAALHSKRTQEAFVRISRLMNELGVQVTHVGPWGDIYQAFHAMGRAGAEAAKERPEAEAIKRCEEFFKVFYPVVKREGWLDQAYVRLPDEFRSMDKVRRAQAMSARIRQWAPGMRIQTTAMGNSREVLQAAIGCCDIWSPSGRYLESNLGFYKERVAAGDEVWPYIHSYTWHVGDPIATRGFGWMIQKHGFQGACHWSAGPRGKFEHTSFGLRRDDGNITPGDGTFYYPARKGSSQPFWRCARLARIRDGFEDREYFWLLNALARKAEAAGKLTPPLRKVVADANALPDQIVLGKGLNNITQDLSRFDGARRQLARAIVKLRDALGREEPD